VVPGGAALVHPTDAARAPALAPIPTNTPGSQTASQEGRKKTEIPLYDDRVTTLTPEITGSTVRCVGGR